MRAGIVLSSIIVLSLASSGASLQLAAQEESSAGLAALELPAGARPLGRGRAFVAASGDVQGVLYNPAGLASRDSIGVTFSRYQGSSRLDINGNFGAVSLPLPAGVATLAVNYEDLGELELRSSTNEPLGSRDLRNLLLIGSYALQLGPSLALGASVKYLSSDLGAADGNGFAVDAGALVRPSAVLPLHFGVAVLNVGPEITFDFEDPQTGETAEGEGDRLPSRVRWGASFDAGRLTDAASLYGVELAADVEHDLRELGQVSFFGGVAVDYRDVVVMRGGVLRPDNSFGEESSTGASVGAGVHWRGLRIDIARELGVNEAGDETHFSLGADF